MRAGVRPTTVGRTGGEEGWARVRRSPKALPPLEAPTEAPDIAPRSGGGDAAESHRPGGRCEVREERREQRLGRLLRDVVAAVEGAPLHARRALPPGAEDVEAA